MNGGRLDDPSTCGQAIADMASILMRSLVGTRCAVCLDLEASGTSDANHVAGTRVGRYEGTSATLVLFDCGHDRPVSSFVSFVSSSDKERSAESPVRTSLKSSFVSFVDSTSQSGVPVIGGAAFTGLAGQVVDLIDPTTEASRLAMLVQFLIAYGSACGTNPHFMVGADRHVAREYGLIVGRTGTGRKGTSWSPIRKLMTLVDGDWSKRIRTGLSTGEGLIATVSDVPLKDNPEVVTVTDRRLLVVEPEFSSPLRRARREGNTLAGVVRDAWDTGELGTITRSNAMATSGAHVSVIGHITIPELIRETTSVEASNGLLNRFLFVWSVRSKSLPHPEPLDDVRLDDLATRVRVTLDKARRVGRMQRDSECRDLWGAIYGNRPGDGGLSDHGEGEDDEDDGNLADLVCNRREAHVIRLSLIYALLDGSSVITADHLRSAVETWWLCEESARRVFGGVSTNGVAERLALAMRQQGRMTRTELSHALGNNVDKSRIDGALATLLKSGRVVFETISTTGRPADVYWLNPDAPSVASVSVPNWLRVARS